MEYGVCKTFKQKIRLKARNNDSCTTLLRLTFAYPILCEIGVQINKASAIITTITTNTTILLLRSQ